MLDKIKTFKNGYDFGNLKGAPKAKIRHIGIPHKVIIRLQHGVGAEVRPIVKEGDNVKAGQIIAIDDESVSSPIHSSVNGVVTDCSYRLSNNEINKSDIKSSNTPEDNKIGNAIVIESDGTTDWVNIDEHLKEVDIKTQEGVFKAVYMSGVSSLGLSGIPTPHNTSSVNPDQVKNIVIDATNSEPFSLPVEAIFNGKRKEFIIGLSIINFLFPDADIDIAIDSNKKETYYGLYNTLNSNEDYIQKGSYSTGKLLDKIVIHPLKPKYPQNQQAILTETVFGKVTGAKGKFSAIEDGVLILNVSDIISVYEAVIDSKPLINRTVALGGTGYNINHGIIVRIGTPISTILSHRHKKGVKARIILNSIMTGETLNNLDLPIERSTHAIIAIHENNEREFQTFMRPGTDRGSFSNTFLSTIFKGNLKRADTNLNGEHRACIACNYCEYVCPVQIYPSLISKYVTHDMAEEAENLKIFDCIECGLCSFVCPSKIPILDHIKEGKETITAGNEEDEDVQEEPVVVSS